MVKYSQPFHTFNGDNGEKMAKPQSLQLSKRTFMLFRLFGNSGVPKYTSSVPDNTMPIGTAFSVGGTNTVLTADHVVRELDIHSLAVVCTGYAKLTTCLVKRVESHPEADIAALSLGRIINPNPLEHFKLGVPSDVYAEYEEFPLAEDILAYGFPIMGNEKPINPRMMKGHIQAKYHHTSADGRYRYKAYELSFAAFPGLSGSPVFRDWNRRDAAIGIVTDRISYVTKHGGHETKAYLSLAAALHPVADWIESLRQ